MLTNAPAQEGLLSYKWIEVVSGVHRGWSLIWITVVLPVVPAPPSRPSGVSWWGLGRSHSALPTCLPALIRELPRSTHQEARKSGGCSSTSFLHLHFHLSSPSRSRQESAVGFVCPLFVRDYNFKGLPDVHSGPFVGLQHEFRWVIQFCL